ncbi:metal-dependent hydrolase [compost metagenome]
MKIKWIGQSGYVIDFKEIRLIVDPYLSNSLDRIQGLKRLFPVSIEIAHLHPDFIYCTHNHLDHFDPETIIQIVELFPLCKIIGPISVIEHAEKLKIKADNLILLQQGDHLQFPDFRITATPAFHSDPYSTGLLIETNKHTVYFSGDTENPPALAKVIKTMMRAQPDLFFVCINGKLGNMNINEAVRLTKDIQPKLVIPNHYGMFAENTADPRCFLNACDNEKIKSMALEIGQTIDVLTT